MVNSGVNLNVNRSNLRLFIKLGYVYVIVVKKTIKSSNLKVLIVMINAEIVFYRQFIFSIKYFWALDNMTPEEYLKKYLKKARNL